MFGFVAHPPHRGFTMVLDHGPKFLKTYFEVLETSLQAKLVTNLVIPGTP